MINDIHNDVFDVAIVGGGLAGLSLAILLSKKGYCVVVFEKEKYPTHKVCGEYISMESWPFLEKLGLPLPDMHLPIINKLIVSAPGGASISAPLAPGGFGISRYFLDEELKKIAVKHGVQVREETKVDDVFFKNEIFTICYRGGEIFAPVVIGSFGKRSNLDVKWKRNFVKQKPGKLNNYLGVKYHIKTDLASDTIALHNFNQGYCGVSKIEDGQYCLCYLTTAQNLKDNHNSIEEMEKNVLYKNPFLESIFSQSEFLFPEPVTISQISFDKKKAVDDHIIMIGDAAGMITPLCGNGMSMAFHSSKIGYNCIDLFLQKKISRRKMERLYARRWRSQFRRRLRNGRFIQKLFGKESVTNNFIDVVGRFPFLIRKMIKATHGKEF